MNPCQNLKTCVCNTWSDTYQNEAVFLKFPFHSDQKRNFLADLPSATLHFVGWVEPILDYVGFLRLRRTNLHVVNSVVQCETQQ